MRLRNMAPILAIALAAVAGCAGSADNASTTSTKDLAPSHITIATNGGNTIVMTAHLAANGLGLFQKIERQFKTKITFTDFGSGSDAIDALLGGSADFALFSPTLTALANTKGQDVIAIAEINQGGSVVLVGAKKYEQSRGQDLAKYAHGVWAYTSVGSGSQVIMQAEAEAAGLKWNDLSQVAVGGVSGYLPALQSGRADIIGMDPTSAARAIAAGLGYVVTNSNSPNNVINRAGFLIGNSVNTTRSFAARYPKLTEAVANAYEVALKKVRAQGSNGNAVLGLFTPAGKALLQSGFSAAWQLFAPSFDGITGAYSPAAVNAMLTFLVKYGQISASSLSKAKESWTNQYLSKSG